MNQVFSDKVSKFKSLALKEKLFLLSQKEIDYGIQLEYSWLEEKSKINIYYSNKKKTVSFVIPPKDNLINRKLNEIVVQLERKASNITIDTLHGWDNWIGSDESGKGDYYGPLVVAAFYCQSKDLISLERLGVKDSKLLQDKQINIIAEKVMERFPGRYQLITLTPKKYNELYESFTQSKKNLNHLLAWCHSKVIATLARKFNPQGIFVDRFARQGLVEYYLNSESIDQCDIVQEHKGERDLAVATASILARAKFNAGIDYYSRECGSQIPKGGGASTITFGKKIIAQKGSDILRDIAKLHFKNTQKIKKN